MERPSPCTSICSACCPSPFSQPPFLCSALPARPARTTAEPELRRAFLQRREAWIAGLAGELDDSHSYEFLKRLTDVYRLHLFDVVMQYRAIFADEAPAAAGGGDQVGRRLLGFLL